MVKKIFESTVFNRARKRTEKNTAENRLIPGMVKNFLFFDKDKKTSPALLAKDCFLFFTGRLQTFTFVTRYVQQSNLQL